MVGLNPVVAHQLLGMFMTAAERCDWWDDDGNFNTQETMQWMPW